LQEIDQIFDLLRCESHLETLVVKIDHLGEIRCRAVVKNRVLSRPILSESAPWFSQSVGRGRRKLIHRVRGAVGQGWSRLRHGLTRGRDRSYELGFSKFVNAVANRSEHVEPDLHDALRVSQVIDAAERSAVTGQRRHIQTLNEPTPAGS